MTNTLNKKFTIVLFFLLCLPGIALCQDASIEPKEVLTHAEDEYTQGNYESSKRFVELLASGGAILNTELRTRYIVLNCRLNAVYENKEQMDLWLGKLKDVNKSYEFDAYSDSPHLYSRWKEIRSSQTGKLNRQGKSFLGTGLSEDEVKDRSKFWVGLMPFGVGHFDADQPRAGALYLSGELLLFYLMTADTASYHRNHIRTGALGFLGLIGAWGYEVNSLMPELMNRDDFRAEELRYYLSVAPFGVGQAKNGDYGKAAAMGIAQTGFLTAASMAHDDGARAVATLGALLSYLYGAYDGWVHHTSFSYPTVKNSKFSLFITPDFDQDLQENSRKFAGESPLGLKMALTWQF